MASPAHAPSVAPDPSTVAESPYPAPWAALQASWEDVARADEARPNLQPWFADGAVASEPPVLDDVQALPAPAVAGELAPDAPSHEIGLELTPLQSA
jgi:hypothetical protein